MYPKDLVLSHSAPFPHELISLSLSLVRYLGRALKWLSLFSRDHFFLISIDIDFIFLTSNSREIEIYFHRLKCRSPIARFKGSPFQTNILFGCDYASPRQVMSVRLLNLIFERQGVLPFRTPQDASFREHHIQQRKCGISDLGVPCRICLLDSTLFF